MTQLSHWWVIFHVTLELVPWQNAISWITTLIMTYPLTVFVWFIQSFSAPGIMMLLMHQLRLVAENMTTNEMMNAYRYEHFWQVNSDDRRIFRNPFHKGGVVANCTDF